MYPWQKKTTDPEILQRIPPGQVLTEKFPVLHFGRTPDYPDLSGWDFRVFGEVESPFTLRWAEFRRSRPRSHAGHPLRDPWLKLDTTWEGVPFTHLAEVRSRTDGALRDLPLGVGIRPERPAGISPWTRSACWPGASPAGRWRRITAIPCAPSSRQVLLEERQAVRAMEFTAEDRPGFWERNGYNNSADPWKEERFAAF